MKGTMHAATTTAPQAPAAGRSAWRDLWSRLRHDHAAMTGLVLVALFVLMMPAAPLFTWLTGNDPYTYNTDLLGADTAPASALGGASGGHWFGLEPRTGRDLFAIVTWGSQVSLLIGIASTLVSVVIGVAVGLFAGYFGGWTDKLLGRFTDVVFGFPFLIFAIALAAVVPDSFPRPLMLILVIGLFGWPQIARVVRSETLSLRERGFVRAANAAGIGLWRVLTRELLPNLAATIIVFTTTSIPGKIGSEAALSFLGVGIAPPTPSWGRSISDAISWVQVDPMYLVLPGLALFGVTLGFTLLGDGLRDALDPQRTARAPEAAAAGDAAAPAAVPGDAEANAGDRPTGTSTVDGSRE
jgi:peptide/nickel transport system permease protein